MFGAHRTSSTANKWDSRGDMRAMAKFGGTSLFITVSVLKCEKHRTEILLAKTLFHLYNGLLAELLKRLAELQWQGEAKTVGNRLHAYTSAASDSHPIYSTQ